MISDGHTVAYIQDILVRPVKHRAGIGTLLMAEVKKHYGHLRQLVLITDTDQRQRAFYESQDFVEVHDHVPPLRAFVILEEPTMDS